MDHLIWGRQRELQGWCSAGSKDLQAPGHLGTKPGEGRSILAQIFIQQASSVLIKAAERVKNKLQISYAPFQILVPHVEMLLNKL